MSVDRNRKITPTPRDTAIAAFKSICCSVAIHNTWLALPPLAEAINHRLDLSISAKVYSLALTHIHDRQGGILDLTSIDADPRMTTTKVQIYSHKFSVKTDPNEEKRQITTFYLITTHESLPIPIEPGATGSWQQRYDGRQDAACWVSIAKNNSIEPIEATAWR